MRLPRSILSTAARIYPALIYIPFQIFTKGMRGLYFRSPMSSFRGKTGIGYLSEIGPFCFLNADEHGISIGKYCQINANTSLVGHVVIGDRVLIAPGCVIASGGHIYGKGVQPRFSGSVYKGPLIIGDDVWVGANVTIVGAVRIGSNSVIAAGVVVDVDVPSGSVVKRGKTKITIEPLR